MNMRMDGWKVSFDGSRAKIVEGPAWAVITYFRAYDGREVPDSRLVRSLHHDRPTLDRLIERYQYPAPGSVQQFDFAYGRMGLAVSDRPAPSREPEPEGSALDTQIIWPDADDLPGVEKVYRKVEIERLSAEDIRELYVDWARHRVVKDCESPETDFALHVLAELGGEPEGRSERRYSALVRPSRHLNGQTGVIDR